MESNKLKEALGQAREAAQLMPASARAHTLVGRVCFAMPEAMEKARRAFSKALSLDPNCADTVLAVVRMDMMSEESLAHAISLLEPLLQEDGRDVIHNMLAEVYVLAKNFTHALAHYHHALSLNPESKEAQQGLAHVESLMRTDPFLAARDHF